MNSQPDKTQNTNISTEGGSFVEGDVNTGGGDFVGRDKIVHNVNQVIQQAISAAEEARHAQDLAHQRLAEGVRTYAQRLAAVAGDSTDTDAAGPYKGLLAYTLADAEVFFGRDRAIANLMAQMDRHRLTVLQAESGAGKSSLLHAGIAPRLLAVGHLPVILRPYNRPPDSVIKQTFLPDLAQAPALRDAPLRAFLRPVTEMLESQATLVLILDQFEEFFTQLPDEAERARFVAELADCLEDESLPVRWVLALRSEFFGDLAAFRPRIRNPFQNDFRLNRLTQDEARDVIVRPAQRYGIGYEATLVTRLLEHLSEAGEVHPPQLQLVCLALYQTLTKRRQDGLNQPLIITDHMYQEAGKAAGILRGHLNGVLRDNLPTRQERDLARSLLVALVSSEQRRIRRTRSDLAAALVTDTVTAHTIDGVLDELVVNRLLNVEVDEASDDRRYEIAHDYLLTEIQIDPDVQARKVAQELLQREVESHRHDGKPISKARFDIIHNQRVWLVVDEEAEKLLKISEDAILKEQRDREGARQRQLDEAKSNASVLWRFVSGLAILAVLAVIALGIAVWQRGVANDQRIIAENNAATAVAEGIRADANAVAEAAAAATAVSEATIAETARNQAETERDRANRQTTLSNAQQVAVVAQNRLQNGDSQQALLFGIAALHSITQTAEVENITRSALEFWRGIAVLSGHSDTVTGISASRNGAFLSTASNDHTAKIWDLKTYKSLLTSSHDDDVTGAVFSLDSKYFITASRDRTIKIWQIDNKELVHTIENPGPVRSIGLHPDGTWVAARVDNQIWMWDIRSGEKVAASPYRADADLAGLAFTANGKAMIAGANDNRVYLWDIASGESAFLAVSGEGGHQTRVTSVAESPDGKYIISVSSDLLLLWTWGENGFEHKELPQVRDGVQFRGAAQISPNGKYLTVGSASGIVRVWDLNNLEAQPYQLSGKAGTVVTFSPDGSVLAMASNDGSVSLWNPITKKTTVITNAGEGNVSHPIFSRDGTVLATSDRLGNVTLWRVWLGGNLAYVPARTFPVGALLFTDDRVVAAGEDGWIQEWRWRTGESTTIKIIKNRISAAARSSQDEWLVVGDVLGYVYLLDQAGNVQVKWQAHSNPIHSLQFFPETDLLVSASAESIVKVWQASSGQLYREFDTRTEDVTAIAVGPQFMLVTADSQGVLLRWDLEDQRKTQQIQKIDAPLISLAISADGTWIAFGDVDAKIHVWNLQTNESRQYDSLGPAYIMTFDSLNRLIAGTEQGQIEIWQPTVRDSKLPIVINGHNGMRIKGLVLSDDERILFSVGDDGVIKAWLLALEDILQMACRRTNRPLNTIEWQESFTFPIDINICASVMASQDWEFAAIPPPVQKVLGSSDQSLPIIYYFEAIGSTTFTSPRDVVLRWATDNATEVHLIVDDEDIPVGGNETRTLSLQRDTIYRLHAVNQNGVRDLIIHTSVR